MVPIAAIFSAWMRCSTMRSFSAWVSSSSRVRSSHVIELVGEVFDFISGIDVRRSIQVAARNVCGRLAKFANRLDDATAGVKPENTQKPDGE
jgi:hypothetical protein